MRLKKFYEPAFLYVFHLWSCGDHKIKQRDSLSLPNSVILLSKNSCCVVPWCCCYLLPRPLISVSVQADAILKCFEKSKYDHQICKMIMCTPFPGFQDIAYRFWPENMDSKSTPELASLWGQSRHNVGRMQATALKDMQTALKGETRAELGMNCLKMDCFQ